jgi:uncharacterized damage-inducible protein DinB
MITPEQLANAYALNLNIIKWQTADLSHEDSLLQPPFRGNCLNWLLGHIIVSRHRLLKLLGQPPLLDSTALAQYETDSEPITAERAGLLPLEQLLAILEQTQDQLSAALQAITDDELARPIEVNGRPSTIGQRLFGLYFHETYHTGQTELLRQLAGKNDKII